MKPNAQNDRHSYIPAGWDRGAAAAGPFGGGGRTKAMPASDHDLLAPEKRGPPAGDAADHSDGDSSDCPRAVSARPNRDTGARGAASRPWAGRWRRRIGAAHIDTDDHHWVPTDPPYREKRGIPERLRRSAPIRSGPGAGCFRGARRLGRRRRRRRRADRLPRSAGRAPPRAPARPRAGPLRRLAAARRAMHEIHREFMEWAGHYEDGSQPGRSRPRHERGWRVFPRRCCASTAGERRSAGRGGAGGVSRSANCGSCSPSPPAAHGGGR